MSSACVEELLESVDTSDPNQTIDYASVRQELSQLSLGDLMKLKEKLGAKLYDEVMFGRKSAAPSHKRCKLFSRTNKNRPAEMSSKKRVDTGKVAASSTHTHKGAVRRDPRFDDLSGEFRETHFKQSYSFINDIRHREKQKLLKLLHKCKDAEKSAELQQLITRITQREKAEQEKEERQQRQVALKKKEKEFVAQGKKPFYLKKSEKKKLELAAKFTELQQTGKVTKYIANKKKRNAKQDRRALPAAATGQGQPASQ